MINYSSIIRLSVVLLLLAFFSACEENIEPAAEPIVYEEEPELTDNDERQNSRVRAGCGGIYYDASGQVQIQIFCDEWGPNSHNQNKRVSVGPDYVVIGGGAWADWGPSGSGALLTESRPSSDLTAWVVGSKDHGWVDRHNLVGYAIGLKLQGVSADQLRKVIKIFPATSATRSHPTATASITDNTYELIGGGAKVHWSGSGNLLVHSYPGGSSWYAKSKDHGWGSAAKITSYAIGIKKNIPGFGSLAIDSETGSSSASSGPDSKTIYFSSGGYVLSCPGARTTFSGSGRLLTTIKPRNGTSIEVGSKDHGWASSGTLYAYALRIKKQ